jgi:hypothetical protein
VGTLLIFVVVMWNITGTATNRFNLMTGRSADAALAVESTLNNWSEESGPSTVSVIRTENVAWAADFFGRGARWQTFLARPSGAAAVIGVDLVSTDQPTSLDAYGLAACLGFHGWRMDMNEVVQMPGGRQAEQIVYTVRGSAAQQQAGTPDGDTRSVALISWRQLTADGRVERITLQQPQPVGDWSMTDLETLATELMEATDSAVVS